MKMVTDHFGHFRQYRGSLAEPVVEDICIFTSILSMRLLICSRLWYIKLLGCHKKKPLFVILREYDSDSYETDHWPLWYFPELPGCPAEPVLVDTCMFTPIHSIYLPLQKPLGYLGGTCNRRLFRLCSKLYHTTALVSWCFLRRLTVTIKRVVFQFGYFRNPWSTLAELVALVLCTKNAPCYSYFFMYYRK